MATSTTAHCLFVPTTDSEWPYLFQLAKVYCGTIQEREFN